MTALQAIRAKCLKCVGGRPKDVRNCAFTDCSLYPFRLGKNPNIKLSDEEKARRTAIINSERKNAQKSGEKINNSN